MQILEYFNLPTAIVVAIAVIFLIAEVIKGILTIKNGVCPEILSVRKHIINHRKQREVIDEIPEFIEQVTKGMTELKGGLDELKMDLKDLRDECEERDAVQSRTRILRFDDDVRNGRMQTKEQFDHILIDIDKYEAYCEQHEGFKNGIASHAINRIHKAVDDECFLR